MKIDNKTGYLKWPPLLTGTLIRRYKRFLADIRIDRASLNNDDYKIFQSLGMEIKDRTEDTFVITAHCPNSGSMLGCSEPGRTVYLSRHNNPQRRLKYTWEMIDMPTSLVGTNTIVPNKLVKASIEAGLISGLVGYGSIRSEVKYGRNSRIDLLLENDGKRCYVEIKNCTLVTDGVACFPDAVTTRGLKHLEELQDQIRLGHRSVMFYLVQRMDAKMFRPADHIDPAYGKTLRKAIKKGTEIMVHDVVLDLEGIRLNRSLPYEV